MLGTNLAITVETLGGPALRVHPSGGPPKAEFGILNDATDEKEKRIKKRTSQAEGSKRVAVN